MGATGCSAWVSGLLQDGAQKGSRKRCRVIRKQGQPKKGNPAFLSSLLRPLAHETRCYV